MFQGSGFKRTLCGKNWKFIIGNNTDTARYGCCPKGSYMSSPEVPFNISESCQSCPKGYHGSTIENDETSCQVCPAGRFSVEGASECCGCDEGTYVKTIDSEPSHEKSDSCPSCNKCPLGSFTDARNLYECKSCPKGRVVRQAKLCSMCQAGKQKNNTDEGCTPCIAGMFQKEEDAEKEKCKTCEIGQTSFEGAGACTDCRIGRYGQQTITKEIKIGTCADCPFDEYTDEEGKDECKQCTGGEVTNKQEPGRNYFNIHILIYDRLY